MPFTRHESAPALYERHVAHTDISGFWPTPGDSGLLHQPFRLGQASANPSPAPPTGIFVCHDAPTEIKLWLNPDHTYFAHAESFQRPLVIAEGKRLFMDRVHSNPEKGTWTWDTERRELTLTPVQQNDLLAAVRHLRVSLVSKDQLESADAHFERQKPE